MDQEHLMRNAVSAAFRAALDDNFDPLINVVLTLHTDELANFAATATVVAEMAVAQMIANDRLK